MAEHETPEEEFSLKHYFLPFTTTKAITFIIIIGLLVYCNALFNGFVGDDNGQIVDNKLIHSLANLPLFFHGSTFYLQQVGQTAGVYYRPMLSTMFALIYALSGPNPFFFHLIQLLLHIVNCILIFLLFKK